MRPLKLIMTAFGPYAGRQVIDFEKLGGQQLFLICGPTGAGKSTILDAMCYALYGQTSGGDRSGKGLRSDYAGPDVRTEVTFDFAIGEKRYRITRVPEQMRAGKRGAGRLVLQKPESALYDITDGERLLAAKETEKRAAGLLGVGVEQFRQIILLPQGEFRRLLLADSKERQGIMQQLFHTEMYARLEDAVVKKARDLEKERADHEARLETIFASAGIEGKDGEAETALAAKAETAKHDAAAAAAAYEAAEREEAAFRETYEAAQRLAGAWQRLEAAEAESARLAGRKADMEALAREADRIAAAARLRDAKEHLDQTLFDGKRKSAALGKIRETLTRLSAVKEAAEKEQAACAAEETAQKARQDEAARLARLAEVAGKYSKAERKAGAAERAWKEAAAATEAAGKNAAEAAEKKDRARKTAYALGEVFMRGQAAYLAAGLEEGRPCPVCGALHHPAAARSEEAVPDKKDVDFARKAAEQAEKDAETERLRAEALRKEESRLLAVKKAEDASLALLAGELPEAFRDGAALAKRQAALAGQIADHEKRRKKAAADAAKAAGDEQAAKKEEELTAKEVDALRVQYREDHAALLARARAEGFPDIAAVEPYFRQITKEKELREALARYQASVKAEADKAAAERAVIAGTEKPDMAAWNRARDEKTSLMKETLTAKTRAEEEFSRLRDAKRRAAELFAAEKTVDQQHQLAGRLAILFRGDANGVNLERFVLGALLDDVLLKANLRLKAMSGGRYQLTRRQERDDRRKKSGLDMDVFDSYTGQARPANTLSGGETFLASLSLALGLADVVQEYAGGIRLDAMFIDEGFGTLDSESLDLALRTLTALHGQSRLVGIISHVAELDERIPAKLRIRKTDCGSTAAFEISE